ncbi:MAG: inorganic pyrophosphatase [Fimbriimonadaceae bacterium]|nr:inorganic pyrophosphatase [Chitinophagales bacterium]
MKISNYKHHPWHGISSGPDVPNIVTAFIEIVPTDTVKYEIDKESGYLKIDRPQKYSNVLPALYGFIPQTYCGELIGKYCAEKTKRSSIIGDGDPLDICVFTEKNIPHGDIIIPAIPIGGFRMIDKGQADDKIIAVMKHDEIYNQWKEINQLPNSLIERLRHYFLTYKAMPGGENQCEITHVYGSAEAREIINISLTDYKNFIK